jgi:hypothetical protein
MAALAGALAVAGRAEPRIRAGLHRVPRDEARAVKTGERDLVERESCGERRDGPDTVASGARTLRVAARAEVSRTGSSNSMLADPVAVMNQVARGRRVLRREILVAAVAVAKRPLIPMLVATEARGHLWPNRVRVFLRHGLVATNAVAVRDRLVGAMLEAEMLPREVCTLPGIGGAVAPETGMLVMRLGVATAARRVGGQMQRLDVSGGGHALVAVDAIDPVRRVRAMLERMRRVTGAEAEHARARRQGERRENDERERELHGIPQLRERRASALAS